MALRVTFASRFPTAFGTGPTETLMMERTVDFAAFEPDAIVNLVLALTQYDAVEVTWRVYIADAPGGISGTLVQTGVFTGGASYPNADPISFVVPITNSYNGPKMVKVTGQSAGGSGAIVSGFMFVSN